MKTKQRYFFIAYSVKNGAGNWGCITGNGKMFNKNNIADAIVKKHGFEKEEIVIMNFVEFKNEDDLNSFFDLEKQSVIQK